MTINVIIKIVYKKQLLMKHRKQSHNQITADRIFIGVAGGSAAGKTTLCQNINRQMAFDRNFKVQTISLDSFYKSIDKNQIDVSQYNFDHPLALDFDLAYQVLQKLKYSNEPVAVPQYCFVNHRRLEQPTYANPANIILFEGLMAFHDERIRNMLTYKIFINCDDDIRLCRRIKRDTTVRGRTIVSVLAQYNKFVKNAFRDFIYPTITYADLVIPGARNNRISVDFIVQHIKNVARKKNIFKTAQDTKVVLFGQNQYYDMNVQKNYKDSVEMTKQSFLVFPTSDEHRRELDFFFNTLMSEAFSQDYFEEIFIYQFMKIIKSLLKQLFELKQISLSQIELISIYELREKFLLGSNKKVKILFVPIIFQKQQQLLHYIKKLIKKKQITLIIINLFCGMLYPNKIYQAEMDGLIFLNLYLVANKKRLLDILSANNLNVKKQDQTNKFPRDWLLHNKQLVQKGLEFIANQFKIKYDKLNGNMMQQLLNSQKTNYQGKQQLITYPITQQQNKNQWSDPTRDRKISQILTLPQDHPNLCGFYALHNIKQYPNVQKMRSKSQFLKNLILFKYTLEKRSESLKYLNKNIFDPLQRDQVSHLINNPELYHNKSIATLYLSQNYIINDKGSLKDLTKSLQKLLNFQLDELFLLMGVYNHYYVVRLNGLNGDKHHKIQFIDSINSPLAQIMAGVCSLSQPTSSDINKIKNMKTSLQVVQQLYSGTKTVGGVLVCLRINEIIQSYNKFKKQGQLQKWFTDQYPVQVLNNDLFSQFKSVTQQQIGQQHLTKLKQWFQQAEVKQKFGSTQSEKHPLTKFRKE